MPEKVTTLEDLQHDPDNARVHDDRNLSMIKTSLEEVGAWRSIGIDEDDTVYMGNGVIEAAKQAGISKVRVVEASGDEIIAVRRRGLTSEQKRRAALFDNRSSDLSTFDASRIAALAEQGTVMEDLFTAEEMAAILEQAADVLLDGDKPEPPEAQIDKAEELQQKWQVQPGDFWELGAHRLICGDCREAETWARLMQGTKANGVFTSPPYAEQRKEQYGGVPTDKYVEWWDAVQSNVRTNLAQDGSFFVNIKPHCEDGERVLYVFDLVLAMRRQWGWRFVDEYSWQHGGIPGEVTTRFKNQFEPIYWFALNDGYKFCPEQSMFLSDGHFEPMRRPNISRRQGGKSTLGGVKTSQGLVYPGNVVKAGKNIEQEIGHAAAFPVALPDFFIRAYSDAGDIWMDPFCGSGTVIVAAEKSARRGMGIEMLPKYVAVSLDRWATMTGKTPVRISS